MKFVLMMAVLATAFAAQAAPKAKQETKCAAFARSVMKTAFKQDTRGIFQLVDVKNLKVHEVPSDSDVLVEQLTFASEGATVTVQTMPDYYSAGDCELRSINISRE